MSMEKRDYVRYVCSCGSLKSIAKIYFCRHCLSIRCGYCVCHEVDSYYCPNCLENLPQSEVRFKKNKCSNCFDCPCCSQTLSIRSGQILKKSVQTAGEEELKSEAKKVYYLSCSLCRWNSRDVGIPDQTVACGSWREQENVHADRIAALVNYHKILASLEKQQKERKKFHSLRTFLQFEKFGITSTIARKHAGRPPLPQPQRQISDQPPISIAREDVEELSSNIFTSSVDLTKTTTLDQRLHHPELQAESINDLRPQRKQFIVKRSQRCRSCEHTVSKPDLSATSTKFKIQLAAFYHVPEIRIVTCEPLGLGKSSELLLKFCNPSQHQTQIMFLSLDTPTIPTTTIQGIKEEINRENVQMRDYVRYVCSCGSLKSIAKIYFCRHCLSIRCGYCVCHEVDSYYCPNCLENLPQSEVRFKKNKCSNCFDCPCCSQTLSIRSGQILKKSVQTAGEEELKSEAKKVYYLSCSLCRWNSRDVGIPDQTVACGSWREQENVHADRIAALVNYHKILASLEKQQKERKKFHSLRTFLQFEKFGITSTIARKHAGRPPLPQPQRQISDQPPISIAREDVEELSSNIFTSSVDLTKTTTLDQRLHHPELQAESINDLRPQRKQFIVKRSQRCRSCEHTVSKPDLSATSTKFKIQLAAFYHVPEIRIVTCEPLGLGKSSELLLKFCNPSQHQTQIMFLSLDTPTIPTTTIQGIKEEINRENVQMGCDSPNLLPSVVRQRIVIEEPKPINIIPSGEVVLPTCSLILPPRDDTAEYDDPADTYNFQDDPKVVVWRKGNKAVVRLHVLPYVDKEIVAKNEPVVIGFVMQYGYVNTIATLEHKAPQKLDLKVKIFLTLGNLIGSM